MVAEDFAPITDGPAGIGVDERYGVNVFFGGGFVFQPSGAGVAETRRHHYSDRDSQT
jgi:hypothetical protein